MCSVLNHESKKLALTFIQIKMKARRESRDLTPSEEQEIHVIKTKTGYTDEELKQIATNELT